MGGPEGALGRVKSRTSLQEPVYIVIGAEGNTNFPLDSLHTGFKKHLLNCGFKPIHVSGNSFVNWDLGFLKAMPPKLASMVADDEWNKAIGRMPPTSGTLLARFKVNVRDNYLAVDRAWQAFEEAHKGSPMYAKAVNWWQQLEDNIFKNITEYYINKSRAKDAEAGSAAFDNVNVSDNVRGMDYAWKDLMSDVCKAQVEEAARTSISELSVDQVLTCSVLLITSKLIKIYAFDAFSRGSIPTRDMVNGYLLGSGSKPLPLDFYNFPRIIRDISVFKQKVIGSPMYGPSGMIRGVIALAAIRLDKAPVVWQYLSSEQPGLLREILLAAYRGEDTQKLLDMFMDSTVEVDVDI